MVKELLHKPIINIASYQINKKNNLKKCDIFIKIRIKEINDIIGEGTGNGTNISSIGKI